MSKAKDLFHLLQFEAKDIFRGHAVGIWTTSQNSTWRKAMGASPLRVVPHHSVPNGGIYKGWGKVNLAL